MWDVMAQMGWGISGLMEVIQEGTALLGNYPGSGEAHSALPRVKFVSRLQEVGNDTEPGLETASLTPPRFELSQG